MRASPRIGFVLSGGGSRGAYEAGIIHYLRTDLAKRMGRQPRIDIITGTSVGAINAAFLAATMDDPATQAEQIVAAWRSLHVEDLLRFNAVDAWRAGRDFWSGTDESIHHGAYRYGGVVNTEGLERFVIRAIPWRGIARNLASGALGALSVSTTRILSGRTVVFVQTRDGKVPQAMDAFVRHRVANVGPLHVMASASIPIVFPAVRIGDEYFTDGGLRQNTPMSPAIRLGADRLLLVSLRHKKPSIGNTDAPPFATGPDPVPRPLFVLGKALNALLLDHTENDIENLQRINRIIEAGERAFGAGFTAQMNHQLTETGAPPMRRIDTCYIRPSADIGMLAADFVARGRVPMSNRMGRKILQKLAGDGYRENDLLSYLLFEGEFASELIELGRADARQHEEQLATLFADA